MRLSLWGCGGSWLVLERVGKINWFGSHGGMTITFSSDEVEKGSVSILEEAILTSAACDSSVKKETAVLVY
jgi:hypothetical protein